MDVNIADAEAVETIGFNEAQHLVVLSSDSLRHLPQGAQNRRAVSQISQRQLSDHKWVDQHAPLFQQTHEVWTGRAEMINPDRSVDQDHAGSGLRRGAAFRSG